MNNQKQYLKLFFVFFKVGAFTFGGGYSMLPILQQKFVNKYKWLSEEEFLNFFAIAQITPGIVAANIAGLLGYSQKKLKGAVTAVLGIILPSIIVISAIAAFISNFSEILIVQKALKGINIAIAVLLVTVTINVAKKNLVDWLSIFIAMATFVLVGIFNISPVWLILGSIIMGILARYNRPIKNRSRS